MKTRIIQTSFHSDPRVEALSKDAAWLFMYLLTCPYIGLTGVFELTDKKLCYETKLTPKELEKAKEELKGIVAFKDSWIIIRNSEKHNRFKKSQTTKKAYEREFGSLPDEVKEIVYSIDTVSEKIDSVSGILDTPINNKQEIINNNIVAREQKLTGYEQSLVDNFSLEEMTEFAEKKKILVQEVLDEKEAYLTWITGNPKNKKCWYRNMNATVKGWINEKIKDGRIKKQLSLIEAAQKEVPGATIY